MAYELKVTLKDVGVPVWRRLIVEEDITFGDLHRIIQIAFQWELSHLHIFHVRKSDGIDVERIEIASEGTMDDPNVPQFIKREQYYEDDEFVDDWLTEVNDMVTYIYDFGDDWRHEVVLTKIVPDESYDVYPICIGAENLAPPENSRMEIINELINLIEKNSKKIINDINDEFSELMDDLYFEKMMDPWPETMLLTKLYQDAKPWEMLSDGDIFGVLDPISGDMMYCSVLGHADEMYGLAVYIGYDGFYMLSNLLDGHIPTDFDIQQYQHSLLLSFEDREDLEKEECDLVKAYDVPFRGRKSWPSFRSFKPGSYPWFMNEFDALKMTFALQQVLQVIEEIKKGLYVPDLVEDKKLLVRIPSENEDIYDFESKIVSVEQLENLAPENENEVSELDMRRVKKIKRMIPNEIEFVLAHIDLPMRGNEDADENERPILPIMTLALDLNEGKVISHELTPEIPSLYEVQMNFVSMLHQLNGKPSTVVTEYKTSLMIGSLLDDLDIKMEVVDELPMTNEVIADLLAHMSPENEL